MDAPVPEPSAAGATAPETAVSPAGKGASRLLVALLLLLCLAAGWFAALRFDSGRAPLVEETAGISVPMGGESPPPPDPRLATLETRLREFEARLEESRSVADRLAGLEKRLEEVRATPVAALGEAQARLESSLQTLDVLREGVRGEQKKLAAFVRLALAAARSAPFAGEWEAFSHLAPPPSALRAPLERLKEAAHEGAPSLAFLRDDFQRRAREAGAVLRRAEATDWKDRVLAEVRSLVTIRRLDGGAVDADAALGDRLAALERDLLAERLGAALEKYAALPEPVRATLAPWHDAAQKRRGVDLALAALAALIGQGDETPAAAVP